jgi:glutamate dehydrogenase
VLSRHSVNLATHADDARTTIESRGVVLFKDSSANKGGVTSSSLEVLAALSLTDDEFRKHMCVQPDAHASISDSHAKAPDFYKRYVSEVQASIEENASLEFECLWQEHSRSGVPISILSDQLSVRITDLSTRIELSDALWENLPLRARVLSEALPASLSSALGGPATILARLPINYQRALFGSRLASRFLYASGLNTTEFAFFEYVQSLMSSPAAPHSVAQGAGAIRV